MRIEIWFLLARKFKKIMTFGLIICFLPAFLYSAFEYKNFSASSAGLAGMKTLVDDEAIAVLYNPVLIGSIKTTEFDFFYTKFYDVDELLVNVAAFSLPFLRGHIGFGYSSFGKSDFYQERIIAAGYKFDISKHVSLGLNYKNLNLSLGEMNQQTNLYAMDFGGRINCGEKANFGFLMSNVNRPTIGRDYKEEIYRDICVGYSYCPIENIKLLMEYVKQVGYESDYRYGVEMNFLKTFLLRIGNQNNVDLWTIGFGIKTSVCQLDYAYNYHFDLGSQHFFTTKFYL